MKYWFTADMHFGHGNIIEYCKRPFTDTGSMREMLIRNWIDTVSKDDTIFHIGDFSFMNKRDTESLVEMLPGRKIFLRGNHDSYPKTIIESLVIRHDGHSIMLTHYPERATPLMTTFCGHVHEKWNMQYHIDEQGKKGFPIVNVGVDVWNYKPVDLETLEKFIRDNRQGS